LSYKFFLLYLFGNQWVFSLNIVVGENFMRRTYNIDVESLLWLPANVYYLNTECQVLGFNTQTASLFALPPKECVGFEYDLMAKIGNWVHGQGEHFQQADLEVMRTKQPIVQVIDPPLPHPDGRDRCYVSTRLPLCDQNEKVVGVLGISVETNEVACLTQTDFAHHVLPVLPKIQTISKKSNPYNLSKRQIECLNWLVQGMSAKEIAKMMCLSPRTIESYLEIIKIKLNCYKRSDLVKKALEIKL
jgi:DNA-binding CsgD family transcriptional regulator